MFLETKNPHPQDKRIKFFEVGHRYEIDGEGGYTSVTTFNHSQFEKFKQRADVLLPDFEQVQ